jgi:hypothetical protein
MSTWRVLIRHEDGSMGIDPRPFPSEDAARSQMRGALRFAREADPATFPYAHIITAGTVRETCPQCRTPHADEVSEAEWESVHCAEIAPSLAAASEPVQS